MATPVEIAGYLALFALVGLLFILVNLLLGRLLRPVSPSAEKGEVYECGEPAIGSGFVQFDLRFYVVALVFIVFDVEVAFLFPLATVLGKATNLEEARRWVPPAAAVMPADQTGALREELGLGMPAPGAAVDSARALAVAAFVAINVFFAVLLVGFIYEWSSGAFDWVRALTRRRGSFGPVDEPVAGGQSAAPRSV